MKIYTLGPSWILKDIEPSIIKFYTMNRSYNDLAKWHLRALLEESPDIWINNLLHYPSHMECFFYDNKVHKDIHDLYFLEYRSELLKVLNECIKASNMPDLDCNYDHDDNLTLDRINERIDYLKANYESINFDLYGAIPDPSGLVTNIDIDLYEASLDRE